MLEARTKAALLGEEYWKLLPLTKLTRRRGMIKRNVIIILCFVLDSGAKLI